MLKLYVKEFLKSRGYEPTPSLLMNAGIGRSAANRIMQDRTQSISLEDLQIFCLCFNCTPNDLFNFVPETEHQVVPEHPILKLQKKEDTFSPAEYVKLLRPEQIAEVNRYLRNVAGFAD